MDACVVERLIAASPEAVYDAWLDPQSLRHWLCPEPGVVAHVACDPRAGGSYVVVMLFDAGPIEHRGTYLELDRPSRIVFTWTSDAGIEDSLVTVTLSAQSGGTLLTIRHERLPGPLVERHRAGWTSVGGRLAEHLAAAL